MIITGVTDCTILAILRHRLHCNTAIVPQLRRLGFRGVIGCASACACACACIWPPGPPGQPSEACCCGRFSGLFGRSSRGTASEICRLWVPAAGMAVAVAAVGAGSALAVVRNDEWGG